jgi:type I restriction enzyme, R subunit
MLDQVMLFEPPFTNLHQDGLLGVFDEINAKKVIQLVSAVNDNALIKVG